MVGWKSLFTLSVSAGLLFIAGCAALPADRGASDVRSLVAQRSGREWPAADANSQTLVAGWLVQPLTADRAVQIALVNNPAQRVIYARLGLASAEVYNAGRLSNPRFSAAVMFSDAAGAASQVTFGLAQSFTDLLFLSARSRLAEGEFERAKQEAGAKILTLAADAETAYYRLVGAQQVAAMRGMVATAAQASADLAQRFFDAGNINALELAQEQSASSSARLNAMQAEAEMAGARNALNLLLGLPAGDGGWKVTDRLPLPLPPEQEDDFDTLIPLARQSRLDLAARQKEVQLLAASLGVDRRTRYVGATELGAETERETDGSRITGPTLSMELPVFNNGAGRVARAEALVDQAEAELDALALEVGNRVQLAHANVLATAARATQFRTALIPQREAVVRRTQEQVSYMLKGQFELLLAKQQEYDAYQGYLEAVRDYWIARTQLAREAGARLPSQDRVGTETVGPTVLPDLPSPMKHMDHGGGMDMKDMPNMKGMEHPKKRKKPASAPKTDEHQHHHGDPS